MPYKDKVKAREAAKERQRKHRSHPVTPDVTPVRPVKSVQPKSYLNTGYRTFGYATRDVPEPAWMSQKRRD